MVAHLCLAKYIENSPIMLGIGIPGKHNVLMRKYLKALLFS